MKEQIKKQVREWLLNGVSIVEVQQRLSWLGIAITQEEIIKLQESDTTEKE